LDWNTVFPLLLRALDAWGCGCLDARWEDAVAAAFTADGALGFPHTDFGCCLALGTSLLGATLDFCVAAPPFDFDGVCAVEAFALPFVDDLGDTCLCRVRTDEVAAREGAALAALWLLLFKTPNADPRDVEPGVLTACFFFCAGLAGAGAFFTVDLFALTALEAGAAALGGLPEGHAFFRTLGATLGATAGGGAAPPFAYCCQFCCGGRWGRCCACPAHCCCCCCCCCPGGGWPP